MGHKYHRDSDDTLSLRKKVYELWVENPLLTSKKICFKLKINYRKHGNVVNNYLSQFRSNYSLGRVQRDHNPHRRTFVWGDVPRSLLPKFLKAGFVRWKGWRLVSNRNEMLVFKDDFGSVLWFKGGLVRLHLKGEVKLARAKELFCRAFSWFTSDQFSEFLDVPLREESKHWVFELGAVIPQFDIRKFERSHGLRIYTDKSHPTAIEVSESVPFWLRKFEEQIDAHLDLIREYKEESRANRKYIEELIRRKRRKRKSKKKGLLQKLRSKFSGS